MKFFKPSRTSVKSSVRTPKLSSHLVKPASFKSKSVSIKAPRFSTRGSKVGKVKI